MLNIYNIKIVFLLFLFYSIIGWIVEVVDQFLHKGRLINRGFLIGPYCPIHGIGALLMLVLLRNISDSYLILFINAIVICSILEYITGFILEKVFKARWWDYSDYKFNLNGRICLQNSILFGVAGLIIVKLIEPRIYTLLTSIPANSLNVICVILLFIFVIDLVVSFKVICNFKTLTNDLLKDSTEEISAKVKNVLSKKSFLLKRLVRAFPNLKSGVRKIKENIINILDYVTK